MSFLVYPTIKESPILSMLGMGGGGTGTALAGGGALFPPGSVQVTIRSSANSSWDGNYGITLNDGSTEVQITNDGSIAPTDNSLITPNSAALFNTCLQTSTGGIGVGRGSSWGRVDIYFASPINLKVYGSGSGNGGTGCFVEYSGGSTALVNSATNANSVAILNRTSTNGDIIDLRDSRRSPRGCHRAQPQRHSLPTAIVIYWRSYRAAIGFY